MSDSRLIHGVRRMAGRDTSEHHRVSTPLELLYDLTIVVAFSTAGSLLAHGIAFGHALQGVVAFCFVVFAIVWAWISFTWFASAYDTDDWVMRLATLLQMAGIVVIALGLADIFHGFEKWELHNQVMVAGYVTMRVSMIFLWLRAARDDAERRPLLLRYAGFTALAQVGWILQAILHLPWAALLPLLVVLYALELAGPIVTERMGGLPWHPHHIAERYGLLVIISLGEIVLGTTIAVQALIGTQGWSVEAVLVVAAGLAIAFGIWWVYFGVPFGEVLDLRPRRGIVFGYGHIAMYGAIAAIGAGLHVAAYYIEQENGTTVTEPGTVWSIAIPLAVVVTLFFGLVHRMLPGRDRLHAVLLLLSTVVLAGGVALAYAGASLGVSLVVLLVVPWISVVGYETRGHAHLERMLDRLRKDPA